MVSKATGLHQFPIPGLDRLFMQLTGLNHFNAEFDKVKHLHGIAFIDAVLTLLGIHIDICDEDIARIPKKGAFIMLANHPYGGIEGLIILKILYQVRPEAKVVANYLLQQIANIKDAFIPVDPFHEVPIAANATGLKIMWKALEQGTPVVIFPAGEVSSYQYDIQQITDKKWHPVIGKFLCKMAAPVIPVFFHGHNSAAFIWLGQLHPKLRTMRLPAELFNKKGKTIRVRIGEKIQVHRLDESLQKPDRLLEYVRARTYALGMDISKNKWAWTERNLFKKPAKPQPIAAAISTVQLEAELNNLPHCILLRSGNFTVYLAASAQIPLTLREIGRLREITFRQVGEGTNLALDLDVFDIHYRQLFIWHNVDKQIVGGYRIGLGEELMYAQGKRGFYLSQLFKMKQEFVQILPQAMELGRSWIGSEYQKQPMPLYLLWKGIIACVKQYPQYRYLIGPVSISGDFSAFSKSIIIEFIRKNCFDHELAKVVKPKKAFKPRLKRMELENLLENPHSFQALESLIQDIERPNNRFPVLLRQYLQLNAKIIAFNVDPNFNNSLDGLLLLDKEVSDLAAKERYFR